MHWIVSDVAHIYDQATSLPFIGGVIAAYSVSTKVEEQAKFAFYLLSKLCSSLPQ